MDTSSKPPRTFAPAAAVPPPAYCPVPAHAPGRPRLDDHIAPVEDDERIEIIQGERLSAMAPPWTRIRESTGGTPGAAPAHSRPQARLAAVLVAVAAPGYAAHVELLTRHDVEDDFVTDACLLKEGSDRRTGDRYLEEVAFEVANEQSQGNLKKKAQLMAERGVRRIFGILVKRGVVLEWTRELMDFTILGQEQEITDPCLRVPLKVKALLDGAAAELQVIEALLRGGNQELVEMALQVLREKGMLAEMEARAEDRGHKEGHKEGLVEAIRSLCEVLGIPLSPMQEAGLLAQDVEDLRIVLQHIKRTRRLQP